MATHFTEIFRLGLVSEEEEHLQVSHLRVLPQDRPCREIDRALRLQTYEICEESHEP